MMVDANPFPEAPVNMINLNWVERGKGKTTVNIGESRRCANRSIKGSMRLPNRPQVAMVK